MSLINLVPRNNQGFVLATTLWILVVITLGASFFALWSQRVVLDSRHDQEVLSQNVSMVSTKAVILYLLATQPMGIDGLHIPSEFNEEGQQKFHKESFVSFSLRVPGPFISLADLSYFGINGSVFSIQDEAGLIGLNKFQNPIMRGVLSQFDVPTQEQNPLLDKLLVYTDINSFHRLNGAEAPAYEKIGDSPPANRYLYSSWETRRVMGWKDYEALWDAGAFPRMTTVARAGIPSLNTAPLQVLQSLPAVDQQIAETIIAYREQKPFSSMADITTAAGKVLPIDLFDLVFFPSKSQRLSIWHPNGVRLREIHVTLTPGSANGAPWIIDYDITVPLPDQVRQKPVNKSEIIFFQKEVSE